MTATVVSHENAVTPEAESIPTRNPHRSPVNPYVRMIAVRFAQMIPTAVIASFLTFALVRIIPAVQPRHYSVRTVATNRSLHSTSALD